MKSTLRWSLAFIVFWTVIAVIFALPQLGQHGHPERVLLSALAQWWSWGLMVPVIVALDRALPFEVQRILPRLCAHLCVGPFVTVVYAYVVASLRGFCSE